MGLSEAGPDHTRALVYIVEDDVSVLKALQRLIGSIGLATETFTSAEAFLQARHYHQRTCLLLDVQLPGMDGLGLQGELAVCGCRLPIVFLTSHDADQVREQALAAGAVAFLGKPANECDLLDALGAALARSAPDAGTGRPACCEQLKARTRI